MTLKVYMAALLSPILHTIQDGDLLAQHPLAADGTRRHCVYRCDDGFMCAIGCVLDGPHLKEVDRCGLNGCGMMTLTNENIIAFPEGEAAEAAARFLQNYHDNSLRAGVVFGSVATIPNWMQPYSHLRAWWNTQRGHAASLLAFQGLVQAMQREDWRKEVV